MSKRWYCGLSTADLPMSPLSCSIVVSMFQPFTKYHRWQITNCIRNDRGDRVCIRTANCTQCTTSDPLFVFHFICEPVAVEQMKQIIYQICSNIEGVLDFLFDNRNNISNRLNVHTLDSGSQTIGLSDFLAVAMDFAAERLILSHYFELVVNCSWRRLNQLKYVKLVQINTPAEVVCDSLLTHKPQSKLHLVIYNAGFSVNALIIIIKTISYNNCLLFAVSAWWALVIRAAVGKPQLVFRVAWQNSTSPDYFHQNAIYSFGITSLRIA